MTDYEREYQRGRGICGDPFPQFVAFFDSLSKPNCDVLDLGCGQGRDALFIARRGHRVVGVDLSETGVGQMLEEADAEGLQVQGVVADLREFAPTENYDVIIVDRVLHMFREPEERLVVLGLAREHTKRDGHVLIADVPANRDLIVGLFDGNAEWELVKSTKSFTFAHRIAS